MSSLEHEFRATLWKIIRIIESKRIHGGYFKKQLLALDKCNIRKQTEVQMEADSNYFKTD